MLVGSLAASVGGSCLTSHLSAYISSSKSHTPRGTQETARKELSNKRTYLCITPLAFHTHTSVYYMAFVTGFSFPCWDLSVIFQQACSIPTGNLGRPTSHVAAVQDCYLTLTQVSISFLVGLRVRPPAESY